MKEAFELIHDKLDELAEEARNFEPNTLVVSLGKMGCFMYEVEAEYTKNIMDELLEAKKNCGEDSDCSQCVFGCEDGCRLQELQITGGNNGWIPCSERLPEEPEENPEFDGKPLEVYLVSFKGTKYPWRAFWTGKNFTDGWSIVHPEAWMPLPESYKPEK
ncbi:MAG: hypothetical protein IKB07_08275 [Lachnospiraceae bacterium]|nr:hypothetical protein [Lachnospiraceae bacterium]